MRNRLQQHVVTSQPYRRPASLRRRGSKSCATNIKGWFQLRKRGSQRLRNLTGGKIEIAEATYRGHSEEHWLRHLECGCIFRGSVHDVSLLNPEKLCPFCYPEAVDDMKRYGSTAALRELVFIMSSGNLDFHETNSLGRPDDHYEFICTIRRCRFLATFEQFVAEPEYLCPFCNPRAGRQ